MPTRASFFIFPADTATYPFPKPSYCKKNTASRAMLLIKNATKTL